MTRFLAAQLTGEPRAELLPLVAGEHGGVILDLAIEVCDVTAQATVVTSFMPTFNEARASGPQAGEAGVNCRMVFRGGDRGGDPVEIRQ
ncbi:hypothetical protein HPB49_020590 [Dermacentor silvarum]|uniref:Uncharacterized protein n=1 Tax=Dermacentor silvarum TaxID=543639 RepID=A0ACB8CHB7_DERSI|nr:hypothetical protein HPB49_020590 [Dermacentor silvarum]